MITWKAPQIPEYTSREKNGVLIGFLSKVNLRNKTFGVLFCEDCGIKSLAKFVYGNNCKHVKIERLTMETALKYTTKDTLQQFFDLHHSAQYSYIDQIITKEYTCDKPITPMFCYSCGVMELYRQRDASDFYYCIRRCRNEFCESCVTTQNTVMIYDRNKRWDHWIYQCVCYKHDTLFHGLYNALYIERYYSASIAVNL
jgi:hypothetical protein